MHLTHVSIRNFRCFASLEVNLERCHAFIGENGSGKTAVLDAIDLATSPSFSTSRINEQDFNSADAGPIAIEVTFSDVFWMKVPDGYTTQAVPSRSVVLNAKRRERAAPGRALTDPFVIEHFAQPIVFSDIATLGVQPPPELNVPVSVAKTEKGFEFTRKSKTAMNATSLALTLRNDMVGFPNVFLFDKDRDRQARMGFNTLLQKIARDLNWRFRSKWNQPEVVGAWDAFYGGVIGTVEDPKAGRIIGPLQEAARKLIGSSFGDLELSLLDLEQPFSKSFLARRADSNQIEQERMGSGVAIVLAYLLLDVVSSLSKEAIIYLIDEPELHLHPQLQHRLAEKFRKADHQTIITTQSDCFVDVSSWRGMTRFLPDHSTTPQKMTLAQSLADKPIADHLDEIRKWHQHETIFFREDNQIFFARKCLLVEGPAEKYALPVLAARLGHDLGELTVISCNGKSKIPYYQLLCRAFEVPYFTMFDLDSRGIDDGDNQRPNAWAADEARWSFATTFEKLLGVSENADHKASAVLIKVDAIAKDEIPPEVGAAIEAISKWSLGGEAETGTPGRARGSRKEKA